MYEDHHQHHLSLAQVQVDLNILHYFIAEQ